MLVVTLSLSSGVVMTELDNNYENWYPHESEAWRDYTFQKRVFGRYNRTEMFIMEETTATSYGVLEKGILQSALSLHNDIADREDFRAICVKNVVGGDCAPSLSLLSLWNFNSTVLSLQSQAEILATVNAGASSVILDAVIGGINRDGTGSINGAHALQVIMNVEDVVTKEEEINLFEKQGEA